MRRFIQGMGNKTLGYPYLNLDYVVKLRPETRPTKYGETPCYACIDEHGDSIGVILDHAVPEDRPSGVVPETSKTVLIAFWEDSEFRYPVLAWAIEDGSATPVICESLPDVYCLEINAVNQPTRWIFPEEATFEDEAKMKAYGHDAYRQQNRPKAVEPAVGEP